jgi:hypothetical protein
VKRRSVWLLDTKVAGTLRCFSLPI